MTIVALFAFLYSCEIQDNVSVPGDNGVIFQLNVSDEGTNAREAQDNGVIIVEPGMCDMRNAAYAVVEVRYPDQTTATFTLTINEWVDGFKTSLLELAPGAYEVISFVVLDENEQPLFATPTKGSEFEKFVTSPLPLSFVVRNYEKIENEIDVLCVEEHTPPEFGFKFWKINLKAVKYLCIFANFCDETGHKVAPLEVFVYPNEEESPNDMIWHQETQGAGEILCFPLPYDPQLSLEEQQYYVVLYINGAKYVAWIGLDFVEAVNQSNKKYLHLNENCDGNVKPFRTQALLAWEDLITDINDMDYNDLVVRSSVTGDGDIVEMTFTPLARGAGYNHDLLIKLPKAGIESVSGAASAIDDGDMKVITVIKDAKLLFGGDFVNTKCGGVEKDMDDIVVTLDINKDFIYNLSTPYSPLLHVTTNTQPVEKYDLEVWQITGNDTYKCGELDFPNGVKMDNMKWLWPIEEEQIGLCDGGFEAKDIWRNDFMAKRRGGITYKIDCP
jgi:LruC domain-containing protein